MPTVTLTTTESVVCTGVASAQVTNTGANLVQLRWDRGSWSLQPGAGTTVPLDGGPLYGWTSTGTSALDVVTKALDRGLTGTAGVWLDDLAADVKSTYAAVSPTLDDPADFGLLACNISPLALGGGSTALPTNGTVYGSRLRVTRPVSVTNLHLHVGTAGATLTSGQSFAALYGANKDLIGVTADCSTDWTSTGYKTHALIGGPVSVPAGVAFVVVFSNGTTRPAFLRGPALAVVNASLAAANAVAFSADTGRTTSMPATLGTFTAAAHGYWFGLS